MLSQATRSNTVRILSGLVMRTQEQVQERIQFLQTQLESLEHYLPETYQYLMDEMDNQQRELMQLRIQDFYRSQQS
jgi:hypothetical protein